VVNVSFALDEVLAGDEHGLTAVDAPGLVETTQIECVKADNVVDRGHGILGTKDVAGDRQGAPVRRHGTTCEQTTCGACAVLAG